MKRYLVTFIVTVSILILNSCRDHDENVFDNGRIRGITINPDQEQQQGLNEALEEYHANYDPEAKMLKEAFSSPGYHTTLIGGEVHRTRRSLRYAVALLDTYDEEFRLRAIDIIDTVLSFQVKDPEHEYFGIWPWFAEESVDQMSPPDRNWADFCGAQLIEIILTHRNRLPQELSQRIDQSIQNSSEAIRRRDVGPGYTNIAIMGTFVSFISSELYGIDTLNSYARGRMKEFYDYTLLHKGFAEYNSPTYTMVALDELSRMRKYIIDPEMRPMIDSLYNIGWEIVASHFHYPTRQWSGPHSRSYRTLVGNEFYGELKRASDGKINFASGESEITSHRIQHQIPESYLHFFTSFSGPRTEIDTFVASENPVIGTTYLTENLSLGSVNTSDLWNQRRNLVGYWGTADSVNYLHLRFLHDDYDFSAANIFSVQFEDEILSAFTFATNGGDTHMKLDRINGKFKAKDLRLRLEFHHLDPAQIRLPKDASEPLIFSFEDHIFSIYSPVQKFEGTHPYWKMGKDENNGRAWLDLVFYSGKEKEFDLEEMEAAVFGLALKIHPTDHLKPENTDFQISNGMLVLKWNGKKLSVPVKPMKENELKKAYTSNMDELFSH